MRQGGCSRTILRLCDNNSIELAGKLVGPVLEDLWEVEMLILLCLNKIIVSAMHKINLNTQELNNLLKKGILLTKHQITKSWVFKIFLQRHK